MNNPKEEKEVRLFKRYKKEKDGTVKVEFIKLDDKPEVIFIDFKARVMKYKKPA